MSLHTCPLIPFLPVLVMAGGSNKLMWLPGKADLGSRPLYPRPCTLSLATNEIGFTSLGPNCNSSSDSYKA